MLNFCDEREGLLGYLNKEEEVKPGKKIPKKFRGQASDRKTEIIMKRCPKDAELDRG